MARIYLCPVVFETDRTNPDTGEPLGDFQYALVSSLPGVTHHQAAIAVHASGENRGRARHPWAICYVEADDWTALEARSDVYHLSTENLDGPISTPVRNEVARQTNLSRADIDQLSTIRALLRRLLREHSALATDEEIAKHFRGLV